MKIAPKWSFVAMILTLLVLETLIDGFLCGFADWPCCIINATMLMTLSATVIFFFGIRPYKRALQENQVILHSRSERVKELTCMYGVANSIRKRKNSLEVINDILALIPSGWHYPEVTMARITLDGQAYSTQQFAETEWCLKGRIAANGFCQGFVEVFYMEERPELDVGPFMYEEQHLVDGIARALSEHLEGDMAKQELCQLRDVAEAANKAKSEFLANMSHELRTPMTAILGFAEILKDNEFDREEQQEFLERIVVNGNNLLALINGILDLSKIEADKIELEPQPCEPKKIAEGVQDLLGPQARAKGLTLDITSPEGVPETIQSDPFRIQQILTNLVSNAIKFTEKDGVRIRVHAAEGHVYYKVTDTGIGLSEAGLAKLFQPFIQADGSTTRRFGGTGLGLHISKKLANLLGGDITVESEVGKGSTFTLEIAENLQ